jgi:alpha-ketoglutarate-dependent 2,4-dichlorophenoxyacetate dioxygenase
MAELRQERVMPLHAKPLHPLFAAEVTGVELDPKVDPATVAEIVGLMHRYAVCAYHHDRPRSNEEHIGFSALLGPMQRTSVLRTTGSTGSRLGYPEIVDQSNLDEYGEVFKD